MHVPLLLIPLFVLIMHRSIALLLLALLCTIFVKALPVPFDSVWTDEDRNIIAFATTDSEESINKKRESNMLKAPKQLVFMAPSDVSEQNDHEELDEEPQGVSFLVPMEKRPRALEKFIWS